MNFERMDFEGDPNLGLYGFATDKYVLTGMNSKKVLQRIEKVLRVKPISTMMLNTGFAGIFCRGNSHGIVLSEIMKGHELPSLKKMLDNVLVLKTDYSAMGNLILMNDNGVIISPLIKSHTREISEFFSIPCEATSIARSQIVGSLGLATNRGCLVHPRTTDSEKRKIKDVLGVDVDIGTVNFGSPFPSTGTIANSNGFIASDESSGPELGRITEALGFI